MTWRRTWASLALTPAIALGLLSGGSTAALAATNIETGPTATIAAATLGQTPGTYTNYTFANAPAQGLSDVEFGIKVTADPGKSAKVFWSNQFQFSDGKNAYTGMQTNGAGNARTFIFSVWDATEAKAGAAGSWCQDFGGEGVGKSCRINVEWVQGHNYKFNLNNEGDRWFGVTVTDTTTGTSFKLGSIRAGSDYVKSTNMVSWTEYFEWNNPKATCLDQPYSRAEIALPRANAGAVNAGVLSTSLSSACPTDFSSIETTPSSTIQTNAIGNTIRGPLIGLNSRVLDGGPGTNNTPLTTKANDSNNIGNQNWVVAKDGTIRLGSATGLCLDAGGTTDGVKALAYTCHAGSTQQWRSTNGTLTNPGTGKCLDVSTTTNEALLYTCHGGANQQWTVPKAG
ncbi:ricin-type beta-trefoil lectin domain protein [Paenarthrobacter sp. NPDC056912]|uniref:RICIN domain-containing protein n=1 Tax=Paenarthrobacter sp. NPDC056912 TaxID=3345965 RepID=UPI00366AAAD5